MKFTVREGFVVAYTDRIKQGEKVVTRDYAFYPEDGPIDLDKAHATDHAHKLEGADKEGRALLEAMYPAPVAPPTNGIDVAAIVAAAVQAALAAQAATASAAKTTAPTA